MRIGRPAGLTTALMGLLVMLAAPASATASVYQTAYAQWGYPPGAKFTIHNASGKCLEIENSSWNNGARAQQWDCLGQPGMYWLIYENPQGSGTFRVVNYASRKCLEIENSSYNNGARAQQWDCVGQRGAVWTMRYCDPNSPYDTCTSLNAPWAAASIARQLALE